MLGWRRHWRPRWRTCWRPGPPAGAGHPSLVHWLRIWDATISSQVSNWHFRRMKNVRVEASLEALVARALAPGPPAGASHPSLVHWLRIWDATIHLQVSNWHFRRMKNVGVEASLEASVARVLAPRTPSRRR